MKKESIDIFVDIVDNYGDMGWVVECILMSGLDVKWRIISDAPWKLRDFFEKSAPSLSRCEIIEKKYYNYDGSSSIIVLSLHAKVDLEKFPTWRAILRINYLTYDPWYRKLHNAEHILSTPERPIQELIYSPLVGTWGVWHYPKTILSRWDWLEKMKLPQSLEEKTWVLLFCYDETFRNFQMHDIPEDIAIFHIGSDEKRGGIYTIPWMARDDFWSLISLSDISLLRGEVSSVRWLMSERPLVWDMYKELGWWNTDESEGFLIFLGASEKYREVHTKINSGKKWTLSDIISLQTEWGYTKYAKIPDFSETLKKTIDSFGFSL